MSALFTAERTERAYSVFLCISVSLSIGSANTYLHLSVYRFCLYLSISGGLSVYVLYLYLSTSVLPIGLQVLSIPIYICRSVGLSVLPIPIHICSAYRSISSAYTYPHRFCLSVYQFCLSIWKRNETPPVNPSIKQ